MATKTGGKHPYRSNRVNLRLSLQLRDRLEDLAELGIYGTNKTEVAENLIREQIVGLIKSDFFERAKKTRSASPPTSRQRGKA
jgi:hypothetical protein